MCVFKANPELPCNVMKTGKAFWRKCVFIYIPKVNKCFRVVL